MARQERKTLSDLMGLAVLEQTTGLAGMYGTTKHQSWRRT